jgi:hypothetical protein
MPTSNTSPSSQVAARLASALRSAGRRLLTVDTTVRVITLGPGGWRLHESSTQVYYAVRNATDSAGTLASGETAPTTSELAAPSAGSPGTGLAWPADGTVTALAAPTIPGDYREIGVKGGAYLNLYIRVASSTATIALEGPFESTQ